MGQDDRLLRALTHYTDNSEALHGLFGQWDYSWNTIWAFCMAQADAEDDQPDGFKSYEAPDEVSVPEKGDEDERE